MAIDLAKTYKPADVEPRVLERWQQAHAFHAEPGNPGPSYCVVIPPPNVTAALHLGHALNNTLQDILIRWRRMAGDNAVWIPGTDHAGIATQTVVEKRVLAEEGKRRTDFSREEFVAKIQAWKDQYEATITNQLKTMGCSCDWERQRFTMDPTCARAVREAFFKLFQDGLIYRGKRLVNWDPATQTALADDEVEMEEIDGQFYYLRYPLADGSGHVTVATTRPETMLGDTAVAINPKDPRAAGLRGKSVRLPIVNRVIPIIEDDYVVLALAQGGDPNDVKAQFATGFLKVTPAHDDNDYLLGQRHKLPIINVLAPDATISKDHGWPAEEWADGGQNEAEFLLGMDRFEAREAVVEWFRKEKLLEDVKPYRHSVGHSYRSHVPIEPYLSDQWYVQVTDPRLAGAALRALHDDKSVAHASEEKWCGQLRIIPERYAKTYRAWNENIRDWCISRQLWWGHRIPIWRKDLELPADVAPTPCPERGPNAQVSAALDRAMGGRWSAKVQGGGEYFLRVEPDPERAGWVRAYICIRETGAGVQQIIERAGWQQDPDVLDTWFSSGLWPISTLGWPEQTPELARWNPSHTLSTAREILTLWVSRMVMFNLYFRDCLPFQEVFIHAMIQDGEGRKMSKSLGNGVDPLDIIHSHGSDAMRFTLAKMTTNTQDVRLPVVRDPATGKNSSTKFDEGRNFANKLWNAVRFALSNLEGDGAAAAAAGGELGLADRWVLARLAALVRDMEQALRNYEFSVYAQGLYDFIWRDLCDWYIEAVKPTVKANAAQRQVLATCLDVTLRLLHPVMPFITEELWVHLNQVMPRRGVAGVTAPAGELLIRAPWPKVDAALLDAQAEADFELIRTVVGAIREVRTTYKVPPRQKVTCSFKASESLAARLEPQRGLLETLANLTVAEVGPGVVKPESAAAGTASGDCGVEVYVHDLIEAGAERQRITKRIDELTRNIQTLTGRLANKAYADRAPAHLVQQTRDQLAAAQKEAQVLQQQLAGLGERPR